MEYKKEYKKYLISSTLDTANNRIASASFISAFAIYLGLSDLVLGIYAVLDTMTNVIQVLAAPLFSKIGQSKKIVLTNYSIYRISSVSMAFIPFLSNDIGIRTILFLILATIYAVTGEMGYITFVNWRMTLIKKEDRTKFAVKRNFLKNTIVLSFSLIMGIVLDKFAASGYELYGFIILFVIVFIIAFIDIAIRVKTYKPEIIQEKISIKDNIIIPAKDKKFRSVLITGALNRFAYGIGTMYLNVFLLRYLNINYLYYSVLNILVNLSEAFSSKYWGKKSESRNWSKIIIPMCVIFIIVFVILLSFNNEQLLYSLPIIYILIGFGNASYEMYDHIAIYETAKDKLQTSYVTFERFIEGIVTMILPMLSYTIFKESNNAIKVTFIIAIFSYIVLFVYYKLKKDKLMKSLGNN